MKISAFNISKMNRALIYLLFMGVLWSCEFSSPNISGPSPDNPITSTSREFEYIILQLDANEDSTAFGYTAMPISIFKELKKEYSEEEEVLATYFSSIVNKTEDCETCLYIKANGRKAISIDTIKHYKISQFHKITSIQKHSTGGGVDHHSSWIQYH